MRKISEILCCVAILCCALSACSDKPATVKVSSFNIWLNTLGGKLPPSQTAKVIEASQTDIVGIQEGHIYEKIGGYDAEGDSRVVTELIRRIRKKMKMYSEHEYIETVWGVGYKFEVRQ